MWLGSFEGAGISFVALTLLVLLGDTFQEKNPITFQVLYVLAGIFGTVTAVLLTWQCALLAIQDGKTPCNLWRIAAIYVHLIGGFTSLCLGAHLHNNATFRGLEVGQHESRHVTLFIDFLYFSTVTVFSVGYGDITPRIWWSKVLTASYVTVAYALQVLVLTFIIQKVHLSPPFKIT